MVIIIKLLIILMIIINPYVIIKDIDNDNDGENNAQSKDKKYLKILKNWVYVNDHS